LLRPQWDFEKHSGAARLRPYYGYRFVETAVAAARRESPTARIFASLHARIAQSAIRNSRTAIMTAFAVAFVTSLASVVHAAQLTLDDAIRPRTAT
jgi:hypothetical protein